MSGTASRRRFLQVTGGAALAAALAACSSDDKGNGRAADETSGQSGEKSGGTLAVASFLGGATESPDPLSTVYSSAMIMCLYDRLTSLTDSSGPKPELATSWSSDDLKTWTFKLRKGVKFHNGAELTAKDVIATFERILDPKAPGSAKTTWGPLIEPGSVVQGEDEYTVVFKLKAGAWDLPYLVSHTYTSIVPAGMTTDHIKAAPIGTGAYKYKSFKAGEKFTGDRNAGYWRENYPKPDEIVITNVDTTDQRLNGLRSKQFNIALNLDPVTTQPVLNSDDIVVHRTQTGAFTQLNMLCSGPLADSRVRQAMKLVVDREQIRQSLLRGWGIVAQDHPIAPDSPVFPKLPAISADIEQAKKLLAEAGHPNGLTIQLHMRQGTQGGNLAQLYQAQAAKAGITIKLVPEPGATMVQGILSQKFQMHAGQYGARPGVALIDVIYGKFGDLGKSYALWSNPKFDTLAPQARGEVDETKRKELYNELAELLAADGNLIVCCFEESVHVTQGVTGFQKTTMEAQPLWNVALSA
ncbi:ABC transporter substrate-binding protein [Sphaerisporangium krabiense]|uniref:Peptide/nickel transport system substrate-binding protein n=1 Tax=Sphaerisporangium krabiense TaxID=763782 RepID=A0A7W9DN92_9ACTN|nr:ABC transporter substrate-binding protein [Sphaerisporangium krabiense]MBB5625132.1 peptide/nickel transport system substrate-binding protein [Sphaerisporangium krabiense]GII67518.1 ABC transporter substrate-binding protein [Sphaerisporangium krabiense]